jgi:hypothetical protein
LVREIVDNRSRRGLYLYIGSNLDRVIEAHSDNENYKDNDDDNDKVILHKMREVMEIQISKHNQCNHDE